MYNQTKYKTEIFLESDPDNDNQNLCNKFAEYSISRICLTEYEIHSH